MAIKRRKRQLFFVATIVISGFAFLYLADLHFLHNAAEVSIWNQSTDELSIAEFSFKRKSESDESSKEAVDQCKKIVINPAEVDVNANDLYFELFESSRTRSRDSDENEERSENANRKEPKLKVFVVPFSHVDPGWTKTMEEYSNATIDMFKNMVAYMPDHPTMTFTWMEICFFEIWWSKAGDKEKEITKKLIKDGKFQISSGSWSMTDEATPYYWATIDNIVEGHQFLKRELDMTPTVMWSNDPFGYSSTVPYLFRLANINRTIIHRIHSSLKSYFGRKRMMDFHYRQFFDSTGQFDTQVHLLPYGHYDVLNTCGPSSGVCCSFDFKRMTHYFCGGSTVEPITKENVARKAAQLRDQYWQLSRNYKHNVALIMLGDDFRYEMISEWSQQHDNYIQLMEYMNRQPDWNIEVRFGTFDDFQNALMERKQAAEQENPKERYQLVSGDFFPYSDIGDYWVGYFTTRPFYKRQDRVVQAMIRAADIASSLVYFSGLEKKSISNWYEKMRIAHRNLGIFQHHDAITGTSKWHVVTDYGLRLQQALLNAAEVTSQAISILTGGKARVGDELRWSQTMPHFNETPADSVIDLQAGEEVKLWIFNPQPYQRSELARFQLSSGGCLVVKDVNGYILKSQLNPILGMDGVESGSEFELLFEAILPPLAAIHYSLSRADGAKIGCAEYPKIFVTGPKSGDFNFPKLLKVQKLPSDTKRLIKLDNNVVATYHSSSTGYLQAIKAKVSGEKSDKALWTGRVEFWHYDDTRSGAYIFEPHQPPVMWPYHVTAVVIMQGVVTDEIHSFTKCLYHKEYLRKFATDPEPTVQLFIENVVDLRHEKNEELVMRIINQEIVGANDTFLTDSLGLQLMPRRYLSNQPIQRSYYPMASQFLLQNDRKRLTLLSGQPHGATSPVPGGLEVMLDRILVADDSKGLGSDSIIRDNVPATSIFRLILENGDFADSRALSLASQRSLQNLLFPPVTFHQEKSAGALAPFTPLQQNFPCDTLFLNIRPLQEASSRGKKKHLLLLHRVLNDCRVDKESCRGSDLKGFLSLFKKANAQDCTLSGIQKDSSAESEMSLAEFVKSRSPLQPMEIRSVCIE